MVLSEAIANLIEKIVTGFFDGIGHFNGTMADLSRPAACRWLDFIENNKVRDIGIRCDHTLFESGSSREHLERGTGSCLLHRRSVIQRKRRIFKKG